jgi:SOS-response transcriptional repressor LexA
MPKTKSYWDSPQAQTAVEKFVNDYWKHHYRSPSYREIMAGLEAKSTSAIFKTVAHLEKKGKIVDRGKTLGTAYRQIVPIWVIDAIRDYADARPTKSAK